MAEGANWIEMSTISKEDILRFPEFAKKYNVGMLELPVTGGVHLAARGKITVLTGGDVNCLGCIIFIAKLWGTTYSM